MLGALIETSQWALRRKGFCVKNFGLLFCCRASVRAQPSESLVISRCPEIQVGDKDILFVQNNGSQFASLIGIMNGRFHLRTNEKRPANRPK